MKLIAAKPIFNSKALGVTVDKADKLFRHANEIHVGARFSIGSGESFKDLDDKSKEQIGALVSRGLVVFDNDANAKDGTIAKIDATAKEDFDAFKAAQKKPASLIDLISDLIESNASVVAALGKGKA